MPSSSPRRTSFTSSTPPPATSASTSALDAESWRELRIEGPTAAHDRQGQPEGNLKRDRADRAVPRGGGALARRGAVRAVPLPVPGRAITSSPARTTDGQELRSTDPLTAELPCPVTVVSPAEEQAVPPDEVVVGWRPAPGVFDPDTRQCATGEEVGLVGYQVIVVLENEEEGLRREFLVDLPPAVTQVPIPAGFIEEGARAGGHRVHARGAGDRGQRQQDDHGEGLPSRVARARSALTLLMAAPLLRQRPSNEENAAVKLERKVGIGRRKQK